MQGSHFVCDSASQWAAVARHVGALGPGEKAVDVTVSLRGVVAARRAHSASTTFLEITNEKNVAVQLCVNREALATAAQADDQPRLNSARDLDQLDVGDVISCHGVPGRVGAVPFRAGSCRGVAPRSWVRVCIVCMRSRARVCVCVCVWVCMCIP